MPTISRPLSFYKNKWANTTMFFRAAYINKIKQKLNEFGNENKKKSLGQVRVPMKTNIQYICQYFEWRK